MEESRTNGCASLRLSAPLVHVALLGDFTHREFQQVARQLQTDAHVLTCPEPSSLLKAVAADPRLELVLVAQVRPGQWDGGWIAELRRRAPLVRIVCVLGTWCAGETRTGRPLAADVRIFWHEFPAWWARQVEALRAGGAADWSFPDGRNGEVLTSGRGRRDACTTTGKLAIVAARDRESAESLGLALRMGGWASVWVRPPRQLPDVLGASAIVYDGNRLDTQELGAIECLRRRYGPLPVVAVVDLPAIDGTTAAEALGTTLVLGKPLMINDLNWALP